MHRRTSPARLFAALALTVPVAAQSFEYDAVNLGLVPGSTNTTALDMNDRGQVVGRAYFSTAPHWRGWVWDATTGFQVLPQPPGLSSWEAKGITDEGIVVGDGGYDGGQAWRYVNGVYEMLDTLPGTYVGTVSGWNEAADVAGTSKDPSISGPWYSFFAAFGGSVEQVLTQESQGYDLNETRQVVGSTTGLEGYRVTPGVGEEFLPPLGQHVLVYAYAVDSLGRVVGEAAHANGNAHVPFLFTDSDGMLEIGDFGGGAAAVDINDRGEVVGDFDVSGGDKPWIWTAELGVRFLGDLVDAGNVNVLDAVAINDRGQVLVHGFDNDAPGFRALLLTPKAPACGSSNFCGTSPNSASSGALISSDGMPSVGANDFRLVAGGVPAGQFGLFFYGATATQAPFGDGTRCIAGPLYRLPVSQAGVEGRIVSELDFTSPPVSSGPGAILPGSTWLFQLWYRDPAAGGAGYSVSNGLEVTFCR